MRGEKGGRYCEAKDNAGAQAGPMVRVAVSLEASDIEAWRCIRLRSEVRVIWGMG